MRLGITAIPQVAPLAGDYALAGFNTFEVNPSDSNNGLSNTSTETAWKNAQASYIADEVRLISGYYADGAGHVPFGWFLIGDPMIRGNSGLYWYTQYPPFQSWSPPPVQYLSAQWAGKNVRGMSGVDEVNYLYGWNPLSGPITIGTNGFTRISCVASASCTVSWAHPSMVSNFSSNFFVITGSGTRLDYDTTATNPCPKPYSLRNTSGPTFTFPAPAGMSSMTLTAQTNPGTTIQQYAASVFDAAENEGPDYGNASLAGPCVDWVHANAFKTYSSQWMRPSGHAPLTFSVAGSADAATVQNWQGNPKISDFTDFYFIGSSPYIARYSSTNALLTTIGAAFRYRFNNFGPNEPSRF